jgi:transcriptional regulator with XRE-family HTH domain
MPTTTRIQNGPQKVPPGLAIESFMGAQIRARRHARQMSLSGLALATHIPETALSDYETGAVRIPAAALVSIIEALDMTLSEVFAL